MAEKQCSIFDTCGSIPAAQGLMLVERIEWGIFIDGASRGNPGAAGAGVYITKNKKPFASHGFFLGKKTNNEAEYYALVLGVFLIKIEAGSEDFVHIISDSELLIKQMKGIYRVRKPELLQLYTIAKEEGANLQVTYEHVLREKNVKADALANEGIDKKKSLPLKFLDMLQRYEIFI